MTIQMLATAPQSLATGSNLHFHLLADQTIDALLEMGFVSPLGPVEMQREGKGGATLRYTECSIPKLGDIRSTYIHSSRVEIFNLMVFPRNPEMVPVFASEFVIFSSEVRVGVVDLQSMSNLLSRRHLLGRMMKTRSARHLALPLAGALPDWAKSHFSPGAVYTSADNLDIIPAMRRAYFDYLYFFRQLARGTAAACDPEAELLLEQYKAHHVAHSPGLTYLSRIFGEDWTRDFLTQKMYA